MKIVDLVGAPPGTFQFGLVLVTTIALMFWYIHTEIKEYGRVRDYAELFFTTLLSIAGSMFVIFLWWITIPLVIGFGIFALLSLILIKISRMIIFNNGHKNRE